MAPAHTADVVVVGLGAMGSAALCELARRGLGVVGLEQHYIGHPYGSSHGGTRVIRKAYAEEPRYVPLVLRAYDLWRALEEETRLGLLALRPGLHLGDPEHPSMVSIDRAVRQHGLEGERLSPEALRSRFGAFRCGEGEVGFLEPDAGILSVERAIAAHVEVAVRRGANVRLGVHVDSIEESAAGARVTTAGGETFSAAAAIVCAGPYVADHKLIGVSVPLVVTRQAQLWFAASAAGAEDLPIFIHHARIGDFYGFPDRGGIKVCRHGGGAETSAEGVDREVHPADEDEVRRYTARHLPLAGGPRIGASICMYSCTPDGHFVIGAAPARERVFFAAGFSGHGFKFAPVIGEILAELVTSGETRHDIELFSPLRL